MLIAMGAVEIAQPMALHRKVRGYPVHQDADTVLVTVVDEVHEVVWGAEAAGRREVAGRLIPERDVEGMLGDGQQLDVREAVRLRVVHQLVRQLAVGEEAVARATPPRAGMHLIDGDGLRTPVRPGAPLHPRGVAPGVPAEVVHDGSRTRAYLGVKAVGVGLFSVVAMVARADAVLVQVAGA